MFEVFQISESTSTRRRVFFQCVDATDGITPETGLTGTGFISKNGAAPAATSAGITEISSGSLPGRYYLELTAAELDTLGQVIVRYKNAACAEVIIQGTVVSFDPYAAGPTVQNIVNGVWDEVRSSHTTAGSFGQGVASVQGNVTGSVASVTGAAGSVTGAVGSVTGNVGGNVVGSIGSVAAGGITAASHATDAIDANAIAASGATEIAAAVFSRAFSAAYGSHTFDEMVKMIAAVLIGKASGIDVGAPIFRNLADSANAVSATTDANGNRSAVTRTP